MTFEICNITDVSAHYKLSPKYEDVRPDMDEINLKPHETCMLRFETSDQFVDRKFVLTNLKTLRTENIHVKGEIVKDFVSTSPSSIRLPTLTTNRLKNQDGNNVVETSLRLVPTSNRLVRATLRFKDMSSHVHMEVNPSQLVLKPNSPGVDLNIRASLVSSVSRSIRSYGSLEIVVEVRCVLTIMICYITPLSIHHTERRGRNHLRKPCNRSTSTCKIRVLIDINTQTCVYRCKIRCCCETILTDVLETSLTTSDKRFRGRQRDNTFVSQTLKTTCSRHTA